MSPKHNILEMRQPLTKNKQLTSNNNTVQADYIKNLRQQIYLLELESRFATKEVETNQIAKNLPKLPNNKKELSTGKKTRQETIIDGQIQVKLDALYGEIERLKHDNERLSAEKQMLDTRITRISDSNEDLIRKESEFKVELEALKARIEELLEIQAHLVESKERSKAELKTQLEITGLLDHKHNFSFYKTKFQEATTKLAEKEAQQDMDRRDIKRLQQLTNALKRETNDALKESIESRLRVDELQSLITKV